MLAGVLNLPLAFDALAWHQHELLFGYVGGVLAGFLLTAIPNWTGRPPVSGLPLLWLALFWATARCLNLVGAATGPWLPAIANVGFCMVLVALALRETVAGRSWRILPVLVLLTCWGVGCALSQAGTLGLAAGELGRRLGFGAVFVLIGLIGGRVVPSFTRNWWPARRQNSTSSYGSSRLRGYGGARRRHLVLGLPPRRAGLPAVCCSSPGSACWPRLARWRGASTLAQPLVLILHLGYGLARRRSGPAWAWRPSGRPRSGRPVAMHALTAGAIGTMTLAIMTRATLGHTGRSLAADITTVWIYGLVQAGCANPRARAGPAHRLRRRAGHRCFALGRRICSLLPSTTGPMLVRTGSG